MQFEADLRSVNKDARTADFVASTERPVETWGGPEVLRMSGVSLVRFRKNPVVLDSHRSYGLDSVIGRAAVKVDKEKRELLATVEYAPTESGNRAWTLVDGGFVRAMSIGYRVDRNSVKRLREGETDGEGESLVTGPALIVRKWELLEVSNCTVPADEDAVRRSFYDSIPQEGSTMATPINFTGAMGERGEPIPTPPQASQAPAPAARTAGDELGEERAARVLEANKRAALAITPRGLEHVTEAAIVEGKSLDQIRVDLKAAQAARHAPVGTPEPVTTPAAKDEKRAEKAPPAEVTPEVLLRSLKNLRS